MRARTRKAGYRGSMNIQDFPPTVYNGAQRRAMLRSSALQFVAMIRVWGAGRESEQTAKAAALALVDTLDKEVP